MLKLSFKQQVLTGFAVSLLFVAIAAFVSYLSIQNFAENSNRISHTYEVIDKVDKAKIELLNAETGLRGYIITQRLSYKNPYNKSINQVQVYINSLKSLITDNPEQQKLADSLEFYAVNKVEEMKNLMVIVSTLGFENARKEMLNDRGQQLKNKFLELSLKFNDHELALLAERQKISERTNTQTLWIVLGCSGIIFILILMLLRYIRRTFDQQKQTEKEILSTNTELAAISALNEHNNWLLSGAATVNEVMQGQQEIEELSANIIVKIGNYIDATMGALFIVDEKNDVLSLTGAYGYTKKGKQQFHFGDSLIGEVAISRQTKYVDNVPDNYIKVKSSLGETPPTHLVLVPILYENKTIAVMELAFLSKPDEKKLQLVTNIAENIGIAFNSALAHIQLKDLFEQTQQQAEELASQQEELRTTNEELIYKTEALQASEEELRVQQEELQQTNAELEEKAQLLEEKNLSISLAREAISQKAQELEISSKYKSEFLANMSHELRTPLNSILILARILKDNKPENLNEDQVKYAGVIQNAGTDLLNLINDILDLSKIESGKIDLSITEFSPSEIKQDMEALFREVANNKKLKFNIELDKNLPSRITTDLSRLEQIIKNLLSNAFKFTPEHGAISLQLTSASTKTTFHSKNLSNYEGPKIAIKVTDTGIGIPADKQQVIFEAFQQADGSTSRKYGGTGLGLSISKELANILGGEIQIESEQNVGSTFTLFIPQKLEAVAEVAEEPVHFNPEPSLPITFDQPLKVASDKNTLLIVEDDLNFAEILKNYAIEKGFEPIMAHSGDIGLDLATKHLPDAIILDIMLPVMDGWSILKALKNNALTKHIPVHMMSAGDEKVDKAKKEGAIGFLKKPIGEDELASAFELFKHIPVNYTLKKVLLIEDQELQSKILTQQLVEKGVDVVPAFTGQEALDLLKNNTFDCIILDLNLPDLSGFELLDQIKSQPTLEHIPVVINTAMELQKEQMDKILKYSEAMVLKSNKSNDRLIDEVSLFMNKLKSENKKHTHKKPATVIVDEKSLSKKKILITDDDMRNIFALSTALQAYDMEIVIANNGREAIEKLDKESHIDMVLMDIMMPEMDGYEAMTLIRKKKQFANLPIIALTAKAMKNDREKCIEAGASDYIAKPIDIDELLSMMRVWLSKQ